MHRERRYHLFVKRRPTIGGKGIGDGEGLNPGIPDGDGLEAELDPLLGHDGQIEDGRVVLLRESLEDSGGQRREPEECLCRMEVWEGGGKEEEVGEEVEGRMDEGDRLCGVGRGRGQEMDLDVVCLESESPGERQAGGLYL